MINRLQGEGGTGRTSPVAVPSRRNQQPGELMSVEVGQMAPDFELKSHLGGTVKLSDFRGSKNVFIAFYPLDWTPV